MQTTDIPLEQIQPITDHVFVRADAPNATSAGGLLIPDVSRQQSEAARGVDLGMGKGTVIAVGPGRRSRKGVRVPVGLWPGFRILYIRFAGCEVVIDGLEHRIIGEEDVFAVLEGL